MTRVRDDALKLMSLSKCAAIQLLAIRPKLFLRGTNPAMKHVLLLLLVLCVASTAVYAADMPKVGDKAPEFSLVSNEGNQVSLKDYKGKWVVLYFYPRNFTSGCTTE